MDLFSWLVIGHLIGDWFLQNKWMAEGKQHGLLAGPLLIHCFIYTAAIGGALLLDLVWLDIVQLSFVLSSTGAVVFISHWLIDGLDLSRRWGNFYRQSATSPVRMVVDQSMHLAVLAFVAHWIERL